jgi:site-specific recombinase XerD
LDFRIVEQDGFTRMAAEAHLDGLWMRALIEVAYTYGWRRGEMLSLQVRQVDLHVRTICLNPRSEGAGGHQATSILQ